MKTTKILFPAILLLAVMASCKKYPDGPSLSLRSRAARVANTWKVEQVLVNGSDQTSTYTSISYTETYDKSGNYSFSSSVGSGNGKWEFRNNDMEIHRSGTSNQSSDELYILKLKEKSFWYYIMDGNDKVEFHLIPN